MYTIDALADFGYLQKPVSASIAPCIHRISVLQPCGSPGSGISARCTEHGRLSMYGRSSV